MTLAQFFNLQSSPHAIVVGPRAEEGPRKPVRVIMLAQPAERGGARSSRRLLSDLIAARKHGDKK